MPSKHFNLNSNIDLPKEIAIFDIENRYLVIAPEKGTYIVLDNFQLKFLYYLNDGHTLNELLKSEQYNTDLYYKLQDLLVQFEFRMFYESYKPDLKKQLSARLYITNACNLRCIHCFKYSQNKGIDELNFHD